MPQLVDKGTHYEVRGSAAEEFAQAMQGLGVMIAQVGQQRQVQEVRRSQFTENMQQARKAFLQMDPEQRKRMAASNPAIINRIFDDDAITNFGKKPKKYRTDKLEAYVPDLSATTVELSEAMEKRSKAVQSGAEAQKAQAEASKSVLQYTALTELGKYYSPKVANAITLNDGKPLSSDQYKTMIQPELVEFELASKMPGTKEFVATERPKLIVQMMDEYADFASAEQAADYILGTRRDYPLKATAEAQKLALDEKTYDLAAKNYGMRVSEMQAARTTQITALAGKLTEAGLDSRTAMQQAYNFVKSGGDISFLPQGLPVSKADEITNFANAVKAQAEFFSLQEKLLTTPGTGEIVKAIDAAKAAGKEPEEIVPLADKLIGLVKEKWDIKKPESWWMKWAQTLTGGMAGSIYATTKAAVTDLTNNNELAAAIRVNKAHREGTDPAVAAAPVKPKTAVAEAPAKASLTPDQKSVVDKYIQLYGSLTETAPAENKLQMLEALDKLAQIIEGKLPFSTIMQLTPGGR